MPKMRGVGGIVGVLRPLLATSGGARLVMLAIVVILSTILRPTPAIAQETDRVLAEALFREGRELMDAGKVAEACGKFAESYRMDRALGTLINLALCHEKEGKTATAWAEFNEAAAEAGADKDDREAFARKHIVALIPELSRLRLVIAPAAIGLGSLEIRLDGRVLGRAAWSSPLPIDPGDHEIGATGEGKKSFSVKFNVPKGPGMTNLAVPALDDAPRVIEVKPVVEAPVSGAGKTQRLIGYVVGGVGLAGIGVGAGFGLNAVSLKADRDGRCGADSFCDQEGVDKDKDARTSALISSIGFIAGGALAVGGIVLVLTAPTATKSVKVGVTPGRGVMLGGTF